MSSSPPPPYSLRPPPYVRPRGQRKPPPKPSRPSSRELLTEALRRAQHAVTLDSNEAPSDVPAAIAAYDEAIGLLKRVIERRSQRSGNASEVERVRDIVRAFFPSFSCRRPPNPPLPPTSALSFYVSD